MEYKMAWVFKERIEIKEKFYEMREIYYNWNLNVQFYYDMDNDFKVSLLNYKTNTMTVMTIKNFLDIFSKENKRHLDNLDHKFLENRQVLTDLMKDFYIRYGGL